MYNSNNHLVYQIYDPIAKLLATNAAMFLFTSLQFSFFPLPSHHQPSSQGHIFKNPPIEFHVDEFRALFVLLPPRQILGAS